MPVSFLGDGLIFKESLPLAFTAGPLAEGLHLARLNVDNQQLLGAEASLEEVRVHDTLKDESPALLHELQRLEFKLNIVLRLVAEMSVRSSALPPHRLVAVSSTGLEWSGDDAPPLGATGLLLAYVNPALGQPLKIPCRVDAERVEESVRIAQLRFVGLSEAVRELLDKLIFRHHRRLVASARLAAH